MGGTGEEEEENDNGIVTNPIIMPRLQFLRISSCCKLMSLPDYLLTAPLLKEWEIINSKILERRYRRGTGEIIGHISNIELNPQFDSSILFEATNLFEVTQNDGHISDIELNPQSESLVYSNSLPLNANFYACIFFRFIALYANFDEDLCLIPESPFYLEGAGGEFGKKLHQDVSLVFSLASVLNVLIVVLGNCEQITYETLEAFSYMMTCEMTISVGAFGALLYLWEPWFLNFSLIGQSMQRSNSDSPRLKAKNGLGWEEWEKKKKKMMMVLLQVR
ncbi:hypothetical protein CFP56_019087 [Quercus suber]|uniref:Uncharacterized protein n=1 Tax=Quercus suber TaxID=58331 RepID=A0AAW0KJK7_QUESU